MDNQDMLNELTQEELEKQVNLNSIRDVTLANGERMLIMYNDLSYEPIVIHIDNDLNVVEEVQKRVQVNPDYQGGDPSYNTRQILQEIAKEQNGFEPVVFINEENMAKLLSEYQMDQEKLQVISALVSKAKEKNVDLPPYERFTYIDVEKEFIISNSGKVLEVKKDELGNIVVQTPDEDKEYQDKELSSSEETKDSDISVDEIETVYEDVFTNGGVPIEFKEEIIKKLKDISNDPNLLENQSVVPSNQRDWYYEAYNKIEDLKKTKTKTLTLESKEAGKSNYIYIAIVVLLIVLAVFLYFIFRR